MNEKSVFLRLLSARAMNDRALLPYVPVAALVYAGLHYQALLHADWLPIHDTLTQFTEFLYAVSAYRNGELPLWNSYLYGGQPFTIMLNHGLLIDPIMWAWIVVGSLVKLTQLRIFVLYHLTGVVFFAFGGLLLAREMTKSVVSAVAAFIILLFCGDAVYWTNQVYSFSIVQYAPWILLYGLRYFKAQTPLNAFCFTVFLGLSSNLYYPVYLLVFGLSVLLLTGVFYFRKLREIDFRTLIRHALLCAPLLAALLLPTYLAYAEVKSEHYQISRFQGPEQKEQAMQAQIKPRVFTVDFVRSAPNMFLVNKLGYAETSALVGIVAFALILAALVSPSRQGMLWFCIAYVMILNIIGPDGPLYRLNHLLVPYYAIIRTFGYFSGFINLSLAMLACIAVRDLTEEVPGAPLWKKLIGPAVALLAALFARADNRTASALMIVFFSAALVLRDKGLKNALWRAAFKHALLLALLLMGAYNLHLIKGNINHTVHAPLFSYNDAFNFSVQRPDQYVARRVGLFLNNDAECCTTNYNIAEKTDGPYFFFNWGSVHTLLVNKEYYHAYFLPGFGELMKNKLYVFTNYRIAENIYDYPDLLRGSVLALSDDSQVSNRNARVRDAVPEGAAAGPSEPVFLASVLKKTANTVRFAVKTNRDMFVLYTDLYDKDFHALLDGHEVPLLKGMGLFKAVEMPAGSHELEFQYRPLYGYVLAGYLVLSCGFLICLLASGTAAFLGTIMRRERA